MQVLVVAHRVPGADGLGRHCAALLHAAWPRTEPGPELLVLGIRLHPQAGIGSQRAVQVELELRLHDGSRLASRHWGDHVLAVLPEAVAAVVGQSQSAPEPVAA